jgi:hypothetical protein
VILALLAAGGYLLGGFNWVKNRFEPAPCPRYSSLQGRDLPVMTERRTISEAGVRGLLLRYAEAWSERDRADLEQMLSSDVCRYVGSSEPAAGEEQTLEVIEGQWRDLRTTSYRLSRLSIRAGTDEAVASALYEVRYGERGVDDGEIRFHLDADRGGLQIDELYFPAGRR